MKKYLIAVALLGLFAAACGGDGDGSSPVPPDPDVTCLDLVAAIDARESARADMGKLDDAWNAGDPVNSGVYMKKVSNDYATIATAVQADSTAYGYANDVAAGYNAAAQFIAEDSVDEAESSMDNADIAVVKLTAHIRTGDLEAPFCESPDVDPDDGGVGDVLGGG